MQHFSIRLEVAHEEAFGLWWESMRNLGWNRWSDDLATYLKASQSNAMIIGGLGDKTVGHILASVFENKTGWVGLFVVQPQYRGRLFGRPLLDAAMNRFKLHTTTHVGLDSVIEQKSTYERRGFVASPLGKIRCMAYKLSLPSGHSPISEPDSTSSKLRLVDLAEIPYWILSQSDCDHTGFKRDGLWRDGIQNRADFFGLALVEHEKPFVKGSVHGWVAVRRASEGYRLGPVYAADAAASRTLIMAAMRSTFARSSASREQDEILGSDIYMAAEVWGGNPKAVGIFEELDWNCTGTEYYRMWLEGVIPLPQDEGGLAQRGMFAIFDAVVG